MNTLLRKIRSFIPVVSIAVFISACARQPEDFARDNPFDAGGSNWYQPSVTAMNDTTVSINDSVSVTATGTDNKAVVKYVWAKNGTDYSDTTVAGTLTVAWPDIGRKVVRVMAIDNDGVPSLPDSCIVTVLRDLPVPDAGPDTTVSINDTVRLHGMAVDMYGYITLLEWDIGNIGTFAANAGGDTVIVAPASEDLNYLCVLRVTDDDGNTAKDTVRVNVRQDVPIITAGKDTAVNINDTVILHGSATQQFGSIVQWEWKIDSGSWTITGSPDTTIVMPDSERTVICSLAVMDDDGNRAFDEIQIIVYSSVSGISAGYFHSLILKNDSTLWACGFNYYGQLGVGTSTDTNVPVRVMGGVQAIAGGHNHSLLIKFDGTLWGCGLNNYGQLGDGTNLNRYMPVSVMSDVQGITGGWAFSLILKNDNTLWACGANENGQLGNGTRQDTVNPALVMSGVQSVSAGAYHTLIVKNNNELWSCGFDGNGQLGDDTAGISSDTPVYVMSDVLKAAAGYYHTLILKNDHTLWACGYNGNGQLGDGTYTSRFTPVQVMSDVLDMAGGGNHSLILKGDSTLWSCGNNFSGQLGDGTRITRTRPVLIMSGVQKMAAGNEHSLILKLDGTLWACGYNYSGQLGDGTLTERILPVRIVPPQQ